jgi:hypothetical protein
MNRFTARRLVIDDPRIAALPVSGVLLTDRPDDFVAAIAAFYPLKTERASPGLARLTWRQKPDDPGLFRTCPGCIWNLLDPEGAALAKDYTPEDALDLAPRIGARATRLGDIASTISVGKRADLLLLRTDRIGFAMMRWPIEWSTSPSVMKCPWSFPSSQAS